MGKRPKVPAALHSELSEYSSLLRALRTSDTLDLATQLTVPAPTLVSSHDADDEADDGTSFANSLSSSLPDPLVAGAPEGAEWLTAIPSGAAVCAPITSIEIQRDCAGTGRHHHTLPWCSCTDARLAVRRCWVGGGRPG